MVGIETEFPDNYPGGRQNQNSYFFFASYNTFLKDNHGFKTKI